MQQIPHNKVKTALVMPGGGARGAFQVGVLKAIAELLPKRSPNPFAVISGTSASNEKYSDLQLPNGCLRVLKEMS